MRLKKITREALLHKREWDKELLILMSNLELRIIIIHNFYKGSPWTLRSSNVSALHYTSDQQNLSE